MLKKDLDSSKDEKDAKKDSILKISATFENYDEI